MTESVPECNTTYNRVSKAIAAFQGEVGFQPSFILLGDQEWKSIHGDEGHVMFINGVFIPCRHFDAASFIGVGLNRK